MPSTEPTVVQEHPEFFFTDANVVFIAGTGLAVAFGLHRSAVRRWSPRFRGMLDALDAADNPATFKGRGIIQLGDSSFDFERLVRVMYSGTTSLPTICTSKTFPDLASVLLLSQKYSMTDLFDQARAVLLTAYPFTLSAWDVREAYELTPAIRCNRLESVRRHAPPLSVVSLSLQLNAPHLLVPAYLDLARLPVSEIIRGFTTTTSIASHPPGVTLHLRSKQTTAVLRGKETLQRFIADFIKSDVEFRVPAPQCRYLHADTHAAPSPCAAAFAQVAREMLVMSADIKCGVDSDPLFVLYYALKILGKDKEGSCGHGACTACADWFRQSVYMARQHVWGCLDKWFDLRKVLENGFDAGGWE